MSLFIYGNKYIFSCSSITLKMSTNSDMLVFFNYILITLHTRKHNLALITWIKTTKPNQVYQSYSNTVSRSKFLKEKKKTQRNRQFLEETKIWKSITQSRKSTFLGVDKISLQSTTSTLPLSIFLWSGMRRNQNEGIHKPKRIPHRKSKISNKRKLTQTWIHQKPRMLGQTLSFSLVYVREMRPRGYRPIPIGFDLWRRRRRRRAWWGR